MPELPEAEVVRQGAHRWFAGRTIADVVVHDRRIVRPVGINPAHYAEALRGVTITSVSRRGKFIWFLLDDGCCLLLHLGMTGQVRASEGPDLVRHERLRCTFTDAGHALCYADQRLFGYLQYQELVDVDGLPDGVFPDQPGLVPASVTHIARDPFDPAFDALAVARRLKTKKTTIKRALLDQRIMSGVGNIYADEALWRAKVHYDRPCAALTVKKLVEIVGHCTEVMTASLSQGGTSFDAMYVNVNGASGYFSRSLAVYGQQGKPCDRCGGTIVREKFMNRSAHRCPRCQPRPRKRVVS